MRKIGVIPNLSKDISGSRTKAIISDALAIGMDVLVMSEVYSVVKMGTLVEEKDFLQMSEAVLVLGGDGTLLQTARQVAKHDLPIIGINMGHLGFLTEVEFSEVDKVLWALKNDKYSVERRMMLSGTLMRDGIPMQDFIALNDIAVAKASFARIIHLKVYINNEFVNYYPADGLLVSSPTGSTAYSLSAGGPIISPDMECLLLTPICPHTLIARPIVTDGQDEIKIEVVDKKRDILLTIDGQEGTVLSEGDIIIIRKADIDVKLIRIRKRRFFELLNEKLTERPLIECKSKEDVDEHKI